MRLARLLFVASCLIFALPALADPLYQPRQIKPACGTVDNTTGSAIIPASPNSKRVGLYLFNASTVRAYCVDTTAATCSVAASATNYTLILEPGAVADSMGGFVSFWVTNETNYCCATTAGSTKVCVGELVK